MTKKRVKFGLILGGLAALLLALLALVFAPTGASAGKGPALGQEQDGGGQSDHPNLAYFEPPSGIGPGNNRGHSEDGVGSCVGTLCDTHDNDALGGETWHYADGEGGQGGNNQGGNGQGGHAPNLDSGEGPQGGNGNPWLFAGGGFPGGYGGGAPQNPSNACASQKDKDEDSKDQESGDKKTCDTDKAGDNGNNNGANGNNGGDDAGSQQTQNDGKNSDPNDGSSGDRSGGASFEQLIGGNSPSIDLNDDLPPVDPNCFPFTEGCDTHNGNPPDTVLTDPPNAVPEPLTLSLFAVGLAGAAALRRRQKKAARPD